VTRHPRQRARRRRGRRGLGGRVPSAEESRRRPVRGARGPHCGRGGPRCRTAEPRAVGRTTAGQLKASVCEPLRYVALVLRAIPAPGRHRPTDVYAVRNSRRAGCARRGTEVVRRIADGRPRPAQVCRDGSLGRDFIRPAPERRRTPPRNDNGIRGAFGQSAVATRRRRSCRRQPELPPLRRRSDWLGGPTAGATVGLAVGAALVCRAVRARWATFVLGGRPIASSRAPVLRGGEPVTLGLVTGLALCLVAELVAYRRVYVAPVGRLVALTGVFLTVVHERQCWAVADHRVKSAQERAAYVRRLADAAAERARLARQRAGRARQGGDEYQARFHEASAARQDEAAARHRATASALRWRH
jgi:hypothetical protein